MKNKKHLIQRYAQLLCDNTNLLVYHINNQMLSALPSQTSGAHCIIINNSAMKQALSQTKYKQISTVFEGPTFVCYANSALSAVNQHRLCSILHTDLVLLCAIIDSRISFVEEYNTFAAYCSADSVHACLVHTVQTAHQNLILILERISGV